MKRLLIGNEEDGSWYVRQVRSIVYDGEGDEMVHYCDEPIGKQYALLEDAVAAAKSFLSVERP